MPFEYDQEREAFTKTFKILANTLDEKAFGWVNKKGTLVRGFAVYHYEAFTLGLQPALDRIDPSDEGHMARLQKLFEEIKADASFIAITTGGGRNSRGSLDGRVRFVVERIPQNL